MHHIISRTKYKKAAFIPVEDTATKSCRLGFLEVYPGPLLVKEREKNKFLPLLGKVRMGFKQTPLTLALSRRGERERINSPKRTYSPKLVSLFTHHSSIKKKAAFTLAEGATRVALPNSQRRAAFTLAEVLITLGIIGVVAAMTLPTLIQKHQEKELAVRVRKLYSDINNALLLSQAEFDGNINYSTVFNPNNTHYETAQAFAKYFNGSKVCQNGSDCPNLYHSIKYSYYYTNGSDTGSSSTLNNLPAIILNNGAMLYISQYNNPDCYAMESYEKWDSEGNPVYDENNNPVIATSENTMCAYIYIDVNGVKKPNRYGQDAYRIGVSKTKVLPNAQPYQGRDSLENILSGNDTFVYEDYTVGKPKE